MPVAACAGRAALVSITAPKTAAEACRMCMTTFLLWVGASSKPMALSCGGTARAMDHAAPCGGLAAPGRARAVLSVVALGGTLIRRTAAEEIAVLVEELKPLLAQLQALLPEPVADPTSGTSTHHKVTGSPAPWHGEAGPLLMTIHAGVR